METVAHAAFLPHANPFDDHDDVIVVWPHLKGRLLQDAIWPPFAVNHDKVEVKSYYTDSGSRTFVRHLEIDRHQQDTVDSYAADICEGGVRRGIIGDTWAVAGVDGDTDRLVFLSGMNLIDGAYKAHSESPDNPQVQATIGAGVLNVIVSRRIRQHIFAGI